MKRYDKEAVSTEATHEAAEQCFRRAMQAVEQKRWDYAAALLWRALEFRPNSAEIYNNLGLIYKNAGRLPQAEACLLKAIELQPYSENAFYNLAFVFQAGRRLQDAETCFRKVIALNACHTHAYNNLGVLLEKLYRLEEAEVCYRTALTLDPNFAAAYLNLGKLLHITQRSDEAKTCLYRADELSPDHDHIRIGIAFFHLSLGQYEQGWGHYHAILGRKDSSTRRYNAPKWNGEPLGGRHIVLYCEQGLGDTLHFIRYARQVAAQAGQTSLVVQEPLQRLLAAAFAPLTVYSVEEDLAQDYDFVCSFLLLPVLFRTQEATIPGRFPYIHALPVESAYWRQRLDAIDGGAGSYRVGVVWAGNPRNVMDGHRSVSFEQFSPLLAVPDIQWISLQVGARSADGRKAAGQLLDVSAELTDFALTAGLIAQLDLVITTDTSVAHVAGALGKPTWILLDSYCDWRWQLEREDSPWYPSVRLFRQRTLGDWPEVIARVGEALRRERAEYLTVRMRK